jgi:hypothetical protein
MLEVGGGGSGGDCSERHSWNVSPSGGSGGAALGLLSLSLDAVTPRRSRDCDRERDRDTLSIFLHNSPTHSKKKNARLFTSPFPLLLLRRLSTPRSAPGCS